MGTWRRLVVAHDIGYRIGIALALKRIALRPGIGALHASVLHLAAGLHRPFAHLPKSAMTLHVAGGLRHYAHPYLVEELVIARFLVLCDEPAGVLQMVGDGMSIAEHGGVGRLGDGFSINGVIVYGVGAALCSLAATLGDADEYIGEGAVA